jgi:hypothetical protein
MVASGYRSNKIWNVADDWEPVEGVKQSPSEISEGYPDGLEGIVVGAPQGAVVPLSESLSCTIGESGSSDLSIQFSDVTSEQCRYLVPDAEEEEAIPEEGGTEEEIPAEAETEEEIPEEAEEPIAEGEANAQEEEEQEQEQDPTEARTNLVSSLKISENIQDLATAAGTKAMEATVLVSSIVREGIHLGLSNMVKQLETLEAAVIEQMNQSAVEPKKASKQGTMRLERSVVLPESSPAVPVSCDELTMVSTMGDTYVEYIKPTLYTKIDDTTNPKCIVEFTKESLARAKKKTHQEKPVVALAGGGRVQIVQVRKSRGRTSMRVVTPRSQSRGTRSKSRDQSAGQKKESKASQPRVKPSAVPPTRVTTQTGPLPMRKLVKVGRKHADDDCVAYMVEGSNSSVTTQMKNTSSSKAADLKLSQGHAMFGRNRRSPPANNGQRR